MARHTFSFAGGEELTTMGACWFVSYLYHVKIDRKHLNWGNVSTVSNRKSVFSRTSRYHKFWLQQILLMKDMNLDKNTLGLSAIQIKQMAQQLLTVI